MLHIAADQTAWERAVDEWRALTAVAYVGLAQRAIEIGVAYAKGGRGGAATEVRAAKEVILCGGTVNSPR